jgi:hypothetical protein
VILTTFFTGHDGPARTLLRPNRANNSDVDKLRQVLKITSRFEKDLLAHVPEEHRDDLMPALNASRR